MNQRIKARLKFVDPEITGGEWGWEARVARELDKTTQGFCAAEKARCGLSSKLPALPCAETPSC